MVITEALFGPWAAGRGAMWMHPACDRLDEGDVEASGLSPVGWERRVVWRACSARYRPNEAPFLHLHRAACYFYKFAPQTCYFSQKKSKNTRTWVTRAQLSGDLSQEARTMIRIEPKKVKHLTTYSYIVGFVWLIPIATSPTILISLAWWLS